MLVKIRPDFYVDPDNVARVEIVKQRLPSRNEMVDVVAIVSKRTSTVYLEPPMTIEYVVAALNNECAYRTEYADEVGEVDICILHGNNSRHPVEGGPRRPCLTVDPYPPPLSSLEKVKFDAEPYRVPDKNLGPIARLFSRGN